MCSMCVCVEEEMKQSDILSVNVASWLRKSIKDALINVEKFKNWELCKKYDIDSKARLYEHSPKSIV